jgi:uncharacterized membrane protein YdjX (TVP38/TMEM64 family)
LLLLVLLLGGIYGLARATGWLDRFELESVRRAVADAGALGVLLYLAVLALGVLAQLPGAVFVGAAVLVYGRGLGYVVALAGAILAVCASFALVRAVGGRPLAGAQRPFLKRLLARLETHPVRTMIVLRIVLFISPPITYALALTGLRFRDHALGSALGLVLPTAVVTFALDRLLATPWVRSLLFG